MDIREIFRKTKDAEKRLRQSVFLAPVTRGGRVRISIEDLIYEFRLKERDFEGWAILRPLSPFYASLVDRPTPAQIQKYLSFFPLLSLILLLKEKDSSSWLSFPAHFEDYKKRFAISREVFLHLVEAGEQFQWVRAVFDGTSLWFSTMDRRHSPRVSGYLRSALKEMIAPGDLHYPHLVPEEKMGYAIVFEELKERGKSLIERKLEKSLGFAGARLRSYQERTDHFSIRWEADGEEHIATVKKGDMTVLSAGICLAGKDREFDLTSLVGVMREAKGEDYEY